MIKIGGLVVLHLIQLTRTRKNIYILLLFDKLGLIRLQIVRSTVIKIINQNEQKNEPK